MASPSDLHGVRVLYCAEDGPLLDGERAIVELIGEAFSEGASLIVVPVGRLDPRFFDLRSGVAGALTQKVVGYHLRLAIIGDIGEHLATSNALRAWVRECNRGSEIWFLPTLDDLAARLAAAAP